LKDEMKKILITILILICTINVWSQLMPFNTHINTTNQGSNGIYQPKSPSKSARREVIYAPKERITNDSISNARITSIQKSNEISKSDTAITNLRKKIFGYSIFNNKGGTFEPNLKIATPQNYVVGPDDEIIVDINGYSEEHYNLIVNPDGFVKINKIGNVYVAGLTIEEVKSRLIKKLSAIFVGLKKAGSNMSSTNLYASISLGNIRTVSVTIQGEVSFPGTYSVPSLARVFNVLYLAGGPNENGTFREIQLIRHNRVISTIDLYDILTQGYSKNDMLIHDQDIIKVGVYKSRIELKGKVKKTGIFEVLPTEKLDFIINNFAGGFTEDAFKEKVKITRFTNTERKLIDLNADVLNSFLPKSGDIIQIDPINFDRFENRLEVIGEVFRPGVFSLENNPTLKKLLQSAGGLKENAFVGRINIQRLGDDLNPQSISVNFTDLMANTSKDIALKREDKIYVYSKLELREAYTVTLHGEINGTRETNKDKNKQRTNIANSENIESSKDNLSGNFDNDVKDLEVSTNRAVNLDGAEAVSEISEDLKSNNAANSLLNRQVKLTLPFIEKMTVEDLILKGGGLRESAATGYVEVVRRKKNTAIDNKDLINSQIAEIAKFSISKNLELDKSSSTFELEPFDEVFVRSSPNYELQQFITVKGQVFYPGIYGLEKKDERISDILSRAGGLNRQAFPEGAKLLRISQISESEKKQKTEQLAEIQDNFSNVNINKEKAVVSKHETIGIDLVDALNNPGGVNDLFLNEGDILDIPREPQTVKVTGEVLYPNSVKYTSSFGVKDYISQAGGFTSSSARKRIYVLYSNGSVKRAKNLLFLRFYPKIAKGAEIIVPQKVKVGSTSQQIVSIVSVLTGTVTSIIGIITLIKATAQ